MFAMNRSSFRHVFSASLTILLIFSLSAAVFPQRDDGKKKENKENNLLLEKNRRVNGWNDFEKDGKYYVKILGATNPGTGKKLDGKYRFYYRCKLVLGVFAVAILIAKGLAERELECRLREDPGYPYIRYD